MRYIAELCNLVQRIGNFFLFSKHPLQVKFRSSVQILRKLLVCIEGVDSLQTDNFR